MTVEEIYFTMVNPARAFMCAVHVFCGVFLPIIHALLFPVFDVMGDLAIELIA
jgi:hypothetical protein